MSSTVLVLGGECGGNGRQIVRRRDIFCHFRAHPLADMNLGQYPVNKCDIPATLTDDFSIKRAERWNDQDEFGKKFGADSRPGRAEE
jgi:hypothetical protein